MEHGDLLMTSWEVGKNGLSGEADRTVRLENANLPFAVLMAGIEKCVHEAGGASASGPRSCIGPSARSHRYFVLVILSYLSQKPPQVTKASGSPQIWILDNLGLFLERSIISMGQIGQIAQASFGYVVKYDLSF